MTSVALYPADYRYARIAHLLAEPTDDCVLWDGYINDRGYGLGWDPVEKKTAKANRMAWKWM